MALQLFALCDVSAYLDEGDHNVIAVDWSRLCPGPCYPSAVYNAKFTGKCIAQFLQELRLVGASDVHVVGFSLGAHVAGFAANNLRPYRLPRITGTRSNWLGETLGSRGDDTIGQEAGWVQSRSGSRC